MVDILRGANMISSTPMEINVYKDPHSRMKELVNSVVENIQQELLNLDTQEREAILQSVYITMWELKTHELIENQYIMNKLKDKLSTLKIYNQLVCNCHEDSTLLQIIELVEFLYSSPNTVSTNYYWQRLQTAVYEFMDEFLPHMEEEEQTFLPLLVQYFDYDELKELKETVVEQHLMWKLRVHKEKNLNNVKETGEVYQNLQQLSSEVYKDLGKSSSYCEKLRLAGGAEAFQSCIEAASLEDLPDEMILEVLEYLNPGELARTGAACRRLRQLSLNSRFWRELPLSSWELGSFSWRIVATDPEELRQQRSLLQLNEDANTRLNFYNLFSRFASKIGDSVRRISVSGSSTITNHSLNYILKKCATVEYLDVSYTSISDNGLQSIGSLKHLDMSGCRAITDTTLRVLAVASDKLEHLNVSGCEQITDSGLLSLYSCNQNLRFVDFSGCYRLTGKVLCAFIAACPRLSPQDLSYCNYIEDGPYPLDCNGCQNTDCSLRSCCLSYS